MPERRSYFRINEDILLDYLPVDTYTADNIGADDLFPDTASLNIFADFKRLDSEASQLMIHINEQSRQLGDYLSIINRKLELLAQQLVAGQRQHSDQDGKITNVNLSEDGLAFKSDKTFYKGSHIALHIIFLPSYTGLSLFAQVVRCDATENDEYDIAVTFHRSTESQRQLLSKQIMQSQLAAKRETID